MTLKTAILTVLLGCQIAPALFQPRKTIYLNRMEGLEPFVEKALLAAELPFEFVEEAKQPEMKGTLTRLQSAYGEILYRHKLGRRETHRLELRDVANDRVIAWHAFHLTGDRRSQERAALEFAAKVNGAFEKGR